MGRAMAKIQTFLAALAIFAVVLWIETTQARAAPPPLAFAHAPLLTDAKISPNGRYFFARVSRGDNSTFTVFDLESGGAVVASLEESERGNVVWARWANNDTILFRLGFLLGRRVTLRVEGKAQQYYTESRSEVFVMPVPSQPGEEAKRIWNLTRMGSLVNVLHSDSDHVLIQEYGRGGYYPEVYKRSVRDDEKGELVQRGVFHVYDWEADRTGAVRIGYGGKSAYVRSGKIEYKLIMRASGETEFRDLSDRYYAEDIDQRFIPFEFAENIDQVYVGSNHETDTLALYLFDIREEQFVKQIYHNPDFDVDSVTVDERSGALVSVSYGEDGQEVIWFDEALNEEVDKISVNFPGRDVTLESYTVDADAGVINVSSPTFAGQLFIYDRTRRELAPLPLQHADLPESEMGAVMSVSYKARDAETIPAFVTLPPGVMSLDQARNLPFVMFPHGGPAARDFLRFDPMAQFFATRGYGVLQMNFRGSTGYGLTFEKAGRRQWGRLMQDDISDGVAWLVSEGIADPGRIAIYGGSYGGYAALMGAVLTPELYQCAISFAGVTNLPDLVIGAHKSSYLARLVGDRFREADEMVEYSPLHRATSFAIPVLLIHGRLDGVVPYEHAKDLVFQLRKYDKKVEFVTLPRSGHGLNDYNDRVRYFELLDRYLSNCLAE